MVSVAIVVAFLMIAGEPQPGCAGPVAAALGVRGKYAYVGFGRELVVVDTSDPRRPTVVGRAGYWPKRMPHLKASAIAALGKYVYVVYDALGYIDVNNMAVFDVSNPMAPRFVAAFPSRRPGCGLVVSGERAYVLGTDGLDVLDVSEPTAPKRLGVWNSGAGGSWTWQDVREQPTEDRQWQRPLGMADTASAEQVASENRPRE